jgi:hypothetical protein
MPARDVDVIDPKDRTDAESELIVVGVNNFDSGTFSFPPEHDSPAPYVTITDVGKGTIQFSILRNC